jgi:hypothetical protein
MLSSFNGDGKGLSASLRPQSKTHSMLGTPVEPKLFDPQRA